MTVQNICLKRHGAIKNGNKLLLAHLAKKGGEDLLWKCFALTMSLCGRQGLHVFFSFLFKKIQKIFHWLFNCLVQMSLSSLHWTKWFDFTQIQFTCLLKTHTNTILMHTLYPYCNSTESSISTGFYIKLPNALWIHDLIFKLWHCFLAYKIRLPSVGTGL